MRLSIRWAAGFLVLWALALAPSARAASAFEQQLTARLTQVCAGGTPGGMCQLHAVERRKVFNDNGNGGDVYEYTFQVQVGIGPHDVISVHRVVREDRVLGVWPGAKPVFLVHGDVWGFRGAFMASVDPKTLKDEPFAISLARKGMDVWGIDLRWVAVPKDTTDFTFMKDWNLGLYAQDLGKGLLLARTVRLLTFHGFGQMPLLGWSRGALVSYAYLNMEAQDSADKRQVNGFIPVDMANVFDPRDASQRNAACAGYALLSKLQAQGLYEGGALGKTLQDMGQKAKADPQTPSGYLSGLTQKQAALFAGTSTYVLQGVPVIQGYHFTGGSFDGGIPVSLSYTNETSFFSTLEQAAPFQSIGEQVETLALWCGSPTLPYTSHLRQVTVPVLYVGAAGGVGLYGLYSLSLLGSKDITSHFVQMRGENARPLDFGHMDLFSAYNAPAVVWPRIALWLEQH